MVQTEVVVEGIATGRVEARLGELGIRFSRLGDSAAENKVNFPRLGKSEFHFRIHREKNYHYIQQPGSRCRGCAAGGGGRLGF